MAKSKGTSKRSVIVHKSSKPAESFVQLLGKTEETIQELSRALIETEDSKHKGAGGVLKYTAKQQAILHQLSLANKRFEMLLKLIESS